MKTPVVWVTAALTAAIVLTASFLIATGTRGDNAAPVSPTERVLRVSPAVK
jgi:aldose sugar dehydrogenase